MASNRKALIVGVSGVIGRALAERLARQGWQSYGLSRSGATGEGYEAIAADLHSPADLHRKLADREIGRVFFTAWSRQANERENIRVNGAMVTNVFDALGHGLHGGHAALVTGLKHYLGPFEAYGTGQVPATPFRESQGRQPVDNFYYEQEDRLFDAAGRYGFSWSVHRPHTIIGLAVGNAMNMGVTLAVYASLCKATGQPFVFPGSKQQWEGLTDMTSASLLARHLEWASTNPVAANQDFNVVNGDVFRWQWMWSRIADYFAIDAAPFDGVVRPLETRMIEAPAQWSALALQHNLIEPDIGRLASWWHTDADLGRPMEVLADMTKSRQAGFTDYQSTPDAFFELFDRLKTERLIPA